MGDLSSINLIFHQMKPSSPSLLLESLFRCFLGGLLLLLFCPFSGLADIRMPFKVPPQAVPVTIKSHQGEPVQISLRCSGGGLSISPKYRIRTQPQFGTLTEPKMAADDSVTVIYTPQPNVSFTEDKFTYSVQTREGVSVPAEVIIRMFDDPPLLIASEQIDFGKVLLGQMAKRTLLIENRGGGLAEGKCVIKGDFHLNGPDAYRLGRGEKMQIEVRFAPSFVSSTVGTILYTSSPDRQTTLIGEGVGPIQAIPSELKLRANETNGSRTGDFEILNRTDSVQNIEIRADGRMELRENHVQVAPGQKVALSVAIRREDPEALSGFIELKIPGYSQKVPIQASALGALFQFAPLRVQFGQVPSAQLAVKTLTLENIGAASGPASASIEGPFKLDAAESAWQVGAGGRVELKIQIQCGEPGTKSGVLRLLTSSGNYQVPVEAEIVRRESGAVASAAAASPAPLSFFDPAPSSAGEQRRFAPAQKEMSINSIDGSHCDLSWEAPPGSVYRLEWRRLFLDEKEEIQFSWEPLANVQIVPNGNRMIATVTKLLAGYPYTVRAVAINSAGEVIEKTAELSFTPPGRPPLVTLVRALLACLGILVLLRFAWMKKNR